MGRLINPGIGEQVDRLTVLSLKILYGRAAGKSVDHFENERNALLVAVRARNSFPSWYEQSLALHAVNAALWQAEDELREYRNGPAFIGLQPVSARAEFVAACAFRIQELNDQRSALIAEINQKVGDHLGEEKVS